MAHKKTTEPGGRDRPVDREESDLWRRVTDGIAPLAGRDKASLPPPADLGEPPVPPPPAAPEKTVRSPAAAPPRPPPQPAGPGTAAGVDRRTALRLKRGQLAIEARIDLHGLTQIEAHRGLDAFLDASRTTGRRCVLVITGKSGVLRGAVPQWLDQAPNRSRIIAFTPATPRDGGEGALYVLLRRKK